MSGHLKLWDSVARTASIKQITGAFPVSEIGKTVFLTREEAEKKLENI